MRQRRQHADLHIKPLIGTTKLSRVRGKQAPPTLAARRSWGALRAAARPEIYGAGRASNARGEAVLALEPDMDQLEALNSDRSPGVNVVELYTAGAGDDLEVRLFAPDGPSHFGFLPTIFLQINQRAARRAFIAVLPRSGGTRARSASIKKGSPEARVPVVVTTDFTKK